MQPGGDPLLLCFVDFVSPAHAATAMDALHGNISFSLILVMTTSPHPFNFPRECVQFLYSLLELIIEKLL